MNLRNGQITVGEILSNPKARAIIQQELPMVFNNPMLGMARNMPLNRVLSYARGKIPQVKIDRMIAALQNA